MGQPTKPMNAGYICTISVAAQENRPPQMVYAKINSEIITSAGR